LFDENQDRKVTSIQHKRTLDVLPSVNRNQQLTVSAKPSPFKLIVFAE